MFLLQMFCIYFKQIDPSIKIEIPFKTTRESAGFDICVPELKEPICIMPDQKYKIFTNVKYEITDISKNEYSMYLDLTGKSSNFKKNLFVYRGIMDKDYTGEISVFVKNESCTDILVLNSFEPIAQLVPILLPCIGTNARIVDIERGDAGEGIMTKLYKEKFHE